MQQAKRDFETQFADLTSILEDLSSYEVAWDRVKFRGEAAVGSGGFGEVRMATLDDPDSSDVLAVKILRTHGSKAQRARIAVRLAREIYIMSTTSHPNIIPFTGFYLDRKDLRVACVIAPYMANGNVGEYLDDNEVDIEKRLEFALETGQGLSYLHSLSPPICHADIKPENILVTDDLHLVICDFGISRIMSETNRFTTTSSAKGSTVYMSPELFSADPLSTLKSDVWAWGCLVLMAIMGHISQGIKPAPVDLIMTEVPYLLHLLHGCWQFESNRRFDMVECVSILSSIIDLKPQRDAFPAIAALQGLSRYRIDRDRVAVEGHQLSQGGYAEVFLGQLTLHAQDSQSQEKAVAIKRTNLSGEPEERSLISHPNIVKFIGFVEELNNQIAWTIITEAMHGNVREFLSSGTWSLAHRISLLWDIATGVEYLHTYRPPIIHGDLKSLNVVVNEEGHGEIIDFGSARFVEYVEDQPAISIRWASPEVLREGTPSLSSDIWSLGWTFWEVLTGKIPYEDISTQAPIIVKTVTGKLSEYLDANDLQIQALRDLLVDCLQVDPARRPKASECRGALRYMPRKPPVRLEGDVQWETGSPAPV
ncbi:hypothetical protein FRC01_004415 [Tulasnella sp. 417]|nr:hypothetical protein FRC01_004415 [Tulasnella sp. 417]